MVVRQNVSKPSSNNTTFSNRKVAPAISSDALIHTFSFDDHKTNVPRNYKNEKFVTGKQAADGRDYFEAVKQFSLIKPDTTTSLYNCGWARLELKQHAQTQEAIADFTRALELSKQPDQPAVPLNLWYRRGLAYHNLGKYDNAIHDYNEFINHSESVGERGESYVPRGLVARGLTYQSMYELNNALDDMEEANKLTNENNPYYLCCRASVHATRDERDKATQDIKTATENECDQDLDALCQRAFVLAQLGKHNAALEDYKKASDFESTNARKSDICFQSGQSEYALNNKDQALYFYGRAVTLYPYNVQALYRKGVLQAEKGQYKEALKALDQAHELSPEEGDILLERANVYEQLGKTNEAANDRKRGRKLNSAPYPTIRILGERIKKLRDELRRTNATPLNHLELAMAYDGIINQKRKFDSKVEHYDEAVKEYRAAIQTDTKYLYPQAHALLALCQTKMNDLVKAHETHLDLYEILAKHTEAVYHWKTYLVEITDKKEAGKLEPHLDDNDVSDIIHMELNRTKRNADIETFQYDSEDKYRNQVIFYEQLRLDLANVFAAISVVNLERDGIIYNTENTTNKVGKIVELLSKGERSIATIESKLDNETAVNGKILRKTDYNIVRMRMQSLGNVGNMIDQLDVAQLVARHICTRYRLQLTCIRTNNEETNYVETDTEKRPWWKCCGSRPLFSNKPSFSTGNEILQRISTFATAFIIKEINNDAIQDSSNTKSVRKDALATKIVLLISRATVADEKGLFASISNTEEYLPLNLRLVSKILEDSQQFPGDEETPSIQWELYEFFRAPGIFYYLTGESGKIRYFGASPSMRPNVYGYRLGTREEVDVFKKFKQQKK